MSAAPLRALVARRLAEAVPLLLAVSALTFALLHAAPGDWTSTLAENPAISAETLERMRHVFGLDRPAWLQWLLWVRNVLLHLDFGESFSYHRPVAELLGGALGHTLLLTLAALVLSWGLALPLGIAAAMRARGPLDRLLSAFAAATLSVPELVSGLLLVAFAARTGWLPAGGSRAVGAESLPPLAAAADLARHLVLPACVAALVPLAGRMRQVRSAMLDALALECVTAARAKGLGEGAVVLRHALPNALPPLLALFGLSLGALLSGAFVAEVVFAWPGVGRLTVEAIQRQDPYLVLGAVMMAAATLVAGNLAADVLHALADPRVPRA